MTRRRLLVSCRAVACAATVGAAASCWGQSPEGGQAATPTPPLPAYADEAGPSVYSRPLEPTGLSSSTSPDSISTPFAAAASRTIDQPARGGAAERDPRRLAPPRDGRVPTIRPGGPQAESTTVLPRFQLPLDSIYTTASALAVVLGLFLLCVWALRRGGRRTTQQLPDEVVSVLGRVPLGARQVAQLVRVGNKLVLLSVTSAGAAPLAEITDPAEIDRVLGLCFERRPHSSTSEFDAVFRQLAQESAPAGFLGREATPFVPRSAADVHHPAYRGGADRG